MRKDPNEVKHTITVGIKRKTIKAIDEAAVREGRSRSEFIQRILDKYFQLQSGSSQEARISEIPFRMG